MGGGGGGVRLPKLIIKGKNPCSNMGGNFEIMGKYCNTSRLRCRAVRITQFNFIARGLEGMLIREFFFWNDSIGCILEGISILLCFPSSSSVSNTSYVMNNFWKYCSFHYHFRSWATRGGGANCGGARPPPPENKINVGCFFPPYWGLFLFFSTWKAFFLLFYGPFSPLFFL